MRISKLKRVLNSIGNAHLLVVKMDEYTDIEENDVLETLNKVALARKIAMTVFFRRKSSNESVFLTASWAKNRR